MPVNYFYQSFGAYVYVGTLRTVGRQIGHRQRFSKSANKDGAFSPGSKRDPRRLSFEGTINATDEPTLQTAVDALEAAHVPGPPRPLCIRSDRYINAIVETMQFENRNNMPYGDFAVTFLCYDPFWYSGNNGVATTTTVVLTTAGAANALTTIGSAPYLPIITLVVSAAPAGGLITITNAVGDTCSLAPTATGTYILDTTQESLTTGGVDSMSIFAGDFLTLGQDAVGTTAFVGNDSLTITLTGGVTLSSASVTYQDRWG